jgi:hypothetical protein
MNAHERDVALIGLALFVAAQVLLVVLFLAWLAFDARLTRRRRQAAKLLPLRPPLSRANGFGERPAGRRR